MTRVINSLCGRSTHHFGEKCPRPRPCRARRGSPPTQGRAHPTERGCPSTCPRLLLACTLKGFYSLFTSSPTHVEGCRVETVPPESQPKSKQRKGLRLPIQLSPCNNFFLTFQKPYPSYWFSFVIRKMHFQQYAVYSTGWVPS